MSFNEFSIAENAATGWFKRLSDEIDSVFAENGYDTSGYWNGGERKDELWKEYAEKGDAPYDKKKKHRVCVSKEKDGVRTTLWDMQEFEDACYKTVTTDEIADIIKR